MRTFIFFFALLTNSGFSQSKKSQIEYLSFQIDSVKMVQMNEQKIANRITNSYKVHEMQRDAEMVQRMGISDMWDY